MSEKGYQLPDGEAFTDEMACAIIYYPDLPEYKRALLGSIYHLTTWTAWERDAGKRGMDAAASWKLAHEKTLECVEMACFEELIAAVEALRLEVSLNCFCEYLDIVPGTEPPPATIGVGEVPPTWGGEDVPPGTTWEEYTAIVCGAADNYVNFLKSQAEELANILNLGILGLGMLAGILALLSGGGIAILIGIGSATAIFQALLAAPTFAPFDSVSGEIEAARQDIKDAISCNGDLESVMEGAINSAAWTLFYQWVNWGGAANVVRTGEYGDETLPQPESDTSCDCDDLINLYYDFDAGDVAVWQKTNTHWWEYIAPYNGVIRAQTNHISQSFGASLSLANARIEAGLPPGTPLSLLGFSARFVNGADFDIPSNQVYLRFFTDEGLETHTYILFGSGDEVEASFVATEPIPLTNSGLQVGFQANLGGTSKFVHVDNISITMMTS